MKKFFKGVKKILTKSCGYTLVEVAAVVAVTATLAAVIIPIAMNRIEKSRIATAKSDIQALAAAVGGFYADVGQWPAHDGTSDNFIYLLRTGLSTSTDPTNFSTATSGTLNWFTGTDLDVSHDLSEWAHDHLVSDTRIGNYPNWSGPYTDSLLEKTDPWGHNYLIWVKAMHTQGDDYGWIISVGPDGKLDTDAQSAQLNTGSLSTNDDIGMILYSEL